MMHILLLSASVGYFSWLFIYALTNLRKSVTYKRILSDVRERFPLDFEIGERVYIIFGHKIIPSSSDKYAESNIPTENAKKEHIIAKIYRGYALLYIDGDCPYYAHESNMVSSRYVCKNGLADVWLQAESLNNI